MKETFFLGVSYRSIPKESKRFSYWHESFSMGMNHRSVLKESNHFQIEINHFLIGEESVSNGKESSLHSSGIELRSFEKVPPLNSK